MNEEIASKIDRIVTLQVQIVHLLNPHGGIYGCQVVPAGCFLPSPSYSQYESTRVSAQVGQHSPGGVTGLAQFVTGHRIGWHFAVPLNLNARR